MKQANTISLGSELDKLVTKIIDKEINARINGPSKSHHRSHSVLTDHRDERVIHLLESKEITIESLKKQMHSLFNEVFVEFLKEKCGASHFTFTDSNEELCCLFHQSSQKPQLALFTKSIYTYKHLPNISSITVIVGDVREALLNKNINLKQFVLHPYLEDKIESIAEFIIIKTAFKHMVEATRGMRYKTVAERTHDNFIEWDTYGLTKYYGQEYGKELKWREASIRNNFELIEYKPEVVIEVSK